jgi:hypothetical protein
MQRFRATYCDDGLQEFSQESRSFGPRKSGARPISVGCLRRCFKSSHRVVGFVADPVQELLCFEEFRAPAYLKKDISQRSGMARLPAVMLFFSDRLLPAMENHDGISAAVSALVNGGGQCANFLGTLRRLNCNRCCLQAKQFNCLVRPRLVQGHAVPRANIAQLRHCIVQDGLREVVNLDDGSFITFRWHYLMRRVGSDTGNVLRKRLVAPMREHRLLAGFFKFRFAYWGRLVAGFIFASSLSFARLSRSRFAPLIAADFCTGESSGYSLSDFFVGLGFDFILRLSFSQGARRAVEYIVDVARSRAQPVVDFVRLRCALSDRGAFAHIDLVASLAELRCTVLVGDVGEQLLLADNPVADIG